MAQQKSVTLVINHLLDPQHGQHYEEWLGKIIPITTEFPSHLGANVIQPAAGQNLWSVITHFDTLEHLYAWMQSETRRQLVVKIAPLLTGGDRMKVRAEPAFWFIPPTANVCQPRRWKQFLVTLLVIFPNTNPVPAATGVLLSLLKGSLLLYLVDDTYVIALVIWFWIPIVTRLFAGWLKKN